MTVRSDEAGGSAPRERGAPWTSLALLAVGPTAWILQLSIDFGLASVACEPGGLAHPVVRAPGFGLEQAALMLVNLICLAATAAAGGAAFAALRRSMRAHPGAKEAQLKADPASRRFLAVCGALSAGAFALAILFDTLWPLFVPACWRFAW